MGDAAPNGQNPKRQGGSLAATASKEARTSRDAEDLPGGATSNQFGIPSRGDITLFSNVTQDDRAHVSSYPVFGWPDFGRLFGDNGGADLTHSIFVTAPYGKTAFNSLFTREAGIDPISIALAEVGAVASDQREFRMLDARGNPESPLANSHFLAYKLPERRVRKNANVHS